MIAMYRALGGGWEIRQNKNFVPSPVLQEMGNRTDWGELLDPEALKTEKSEENRRNPDW